MVKENSEGYKEFLVKAVHLWIAGGFFVILCAAFFFLGRWYEKSVSFYSPDRYRSENESSSKDALQKTGASEDLGESLTFFDKLPKESPSDVKFKIDQIQQAKEKPRSQPLSEQKVQPQITPSHGSYSIQVFASQDKKAAQKIYEKLMKKGLQGNLREEKTASGVMYKVRIGKYSTKEEAIKMESRLKREGYITWVIKTD